MKKHKKLLIVILALFLLILIVVKVNQKDNIVYYYKNNSLSYLKNNKPYNITDKYMSNINISKNKEKVLYIEYPNLYLYNTSNRKKYKIMKDVQGIEWLNNKQYIVIDKDKNLYLYNNKKKKVIDKKIDYLISVSNPYIIYKKGEKTFIYNKKKKEIKLDSSFEISENHENIIINKDGTLTINKLSNMKELIKIKNVINYKCINKNCTELYYLNYERKLYLYKGKDKKIAEDVNDILAFNSKSIVYSNQDKDNYKLIIHKGNKSTILDKNKTYYNNVLMKDNKVYYLFGGIVKEVKTSGSKKHKINEDVTSIIDTFKGKLLLLKNNNLYLNDKLLGENIEVDTIKIYKNNIYYLKKKDDIPSMYNNNGKKEVKVKENVGYFTINGDTMYYIGDYNISQKYGNLYRYNSKRIIDKRVTSIVEKSIK